MYKHEETPNTARSADYRRGFLDGHNEGFSAGLEAARQFIENHAGPIVIKLGTERFIPDGAIPFTLSDFGSSSSEPA